MVWRRAALAGIGLLRVFAASSEELHPLPLHPPAQQHYSTVGMASWYGSGFHGGKTADGEVFDMRSLSAAHRTMPLPSYARVTNLGNGRSVIVRVNDRGPFVGGRVVDVSERVADLLVFHRLGSTKVRLDYVGRAPPAGSDGPVLLASFRADGAPAGPEPASLAVRQAPVEGETAVARVIDRQRPSEPKSPYGELIAYPFSTQALRSTPDVVEALAAHAVQRPQPVESRSPYGDLYVNPLSQNPRP